MLVLETNALSVGVQVSPGVPKVSFICVKVIDKLEKISYNIIVKLRRKQKLKSHVDVLKWSRGLLAKELGVKACVGSTPTVNAMS